MSHLTELSKIRLVFINWLSVKPSLHHHPHQEPQQPHSAIHVDVWPPAGQCPLTSLSSQELGLVLLPHYPWHLRLSLTSAARIFSSPCLKSLKDSLDYQIKSSPVPTCLQDSSERTLWMCCSLSLKSCSSDLGTSPSSGQDLSVYISTLCSLCSPPDDLCMVFFLHPELKWSDFICMHVYFFIFCFPLTRTSTPGEQGSFPCCSNLYSLVTGTEKVLRINEWMIIPVAM